MAGDKGVDQVVTIVQNGFNRIGKKIPEACGMLLSQETGRPLSFYISCEKGQNLDERKIGIADSRLGIAFAAGHDEFGVSLLSPFGKLLDEGCLSVACFARDEDHLSPAGDGLL